MTSGDNERYSRQILFSAIAVAGQQRLMDARVAIVGCGALGSFQAGALVRAGVGCGAGFIRIIDRDYVELSNLQRQWLFTERDAAQALPKSIAAGQALAQINSAARIEPLVADLTAANAEDLLGGADLILDGTDNFETRYLINDFAVSRNIPWIYGAAVGSYGLCMAVVPGRTCCLKCIYPEPPSGAQPTCETAGVLGPITAVIAALQSAQALRYLSTGETTGTLTTVDVWTGVIRQLPQPAIEDSCQACGRREFPHLEDPRRVPVSLCGRNSVQIHEHARPLHLPELAARLASVGTVRFNEFALRLETPPYLLTIFPDGRVIVKGTTDTGVARSLYAKYIGG